MGVIRVLPEAVANKIAAGEVVERPASIVKELIENALDAGAKSIEVVIRHGGRSLIRVADDGCGMSADDVELAFQRHATSKIVSDLDLDKIQSYGFRGEALPSIAAVSRLKMLSRTSSSPVGTQIILEGGIKTSVQESPCRPGTIVEISDLFFNTPARRKFLKSETTEMGHMMDVFIHMAYARLDVGFRLKNNDRVVYDLSPVLRLEDRIMSVEGEEVQKNLIPFEQGEPGLRVWGVLGAPAMARGNRSAQSLYLNGRWIKSASLSFALQAGYHGRLMQGQYPFAVICLDLDPARVDVNVHPAKMEVRISQENQIKTLVQQAVSVALGNLTVNLEDGKLVSSHEMTTNERVVSYGQPSLQHDFSGICDATSNRRELFSNKESLEVANPSLYAEANPLLVPEAVSGVDKSLVLTKILGQIHHTFIVVETQQGMMLVDQHAAHERIQFEALLKDFRSGNPARQKLLMDEILEVHPKQIDFMTQSLDFLTRLGFEIEPFGGHTFVVRAVPPVLSDADPVKLLQAFLDEKEEGKVMTGVEQSTEDVAALIACKQKSVKAHQPLPPVALQALVQRLFQCENPMHCPHGRPTFIKFDFRDLEKMFKRIV